ncbi:uncharacterized protein LOC134148452 isoform X7 [Rhea pennata]|uniref:uncharacterized protein LOC134148452 isoform X7 n=1 Tax=Rhea pennata TaxID=8795 RepID=UPI002E2569D3
MKHGAGGPKHSEEVSANQLLLRALAGQSPGAITPASSESLRTQRRHQPRNWPILSWLTAAVMEAGERRRRRKRRRKRERENREQHLRKSEKLLQDLDTAEMVGHFRSVRFWAGEHSPLFTLEGGERWQRVLLWTGAEMSADRPLILLAVRLFRRDKHLARGGNSEGYPQISGAETRAACAQPVPLPAPDSR